MTAFRPGDFLEAIRHAPPEDGLAVVRKGQLYRLEYLIATGAPPCVKCGDDSTVAFRLVGDKPRDIHTARCDCLFRLVRRVEGRDAWAEFMPPAEAPR